MLYFTSDTHYGHKNICRGVTQWSGTTEEINNSTRDFKNVDDMNDAIIDGINSIVGKNDVLYHLGDWSFGGISNIWEFRKNIKCENIHLILGNHDHHIEKNSKLPNCVIRYNSGELVDVDKSTSNWDELALASELFTSVNHVGTVRTGKNQFFLSHYAHRVWNNSHHGNIHLYGHSHNSIDNNWGKSMDVGIDAIFALLGKYRPISVTEVLDIMNKRDILYNDHHNENTN